MKSSLKYLLLLVAACLCSFVIYFLVGPTDENHSIGILYHEK